MKGNNFGKRIASALLAIAITITTVLVGNVSAVSAATAPSSSNYTFAQLEEMYKNSEGKVTAEEGKNVKVDLDKTTAKDLEDLSNDSSNFGYASSNEAVVTVAIKGGKNGKVVPYLTFVGTGDATVYISSVKGNKTRVRKYNVTVGYTKEYLEKNTVSLKFYSAANQKVSASAKNEVKYTVDLYKSDGTWIQSLSSIEALNNLDKDITVNAASIDNDSLKKLFTDRFEIEGYTLDSVYFNWSGDNLGTAKKVLSIKNMGKLSNGHSDYNSFIGFTTNDSADATDYTGNKDYYAYNPTGTLRVAFKAKTYTVTFYDDDKSIISQETYDYGTPIEVPTVSDKSDAKNNYTFAGWNTNVATTCTGNAEYYATYSSTPNTFEVKFFNNDGTTLLNKNNTEYAYGDTLTVPSNPSYVGTDIYTHVFKGWVDDNGNVVTSANLKKTEVTGNATYTAYYETTLKLGYFKYNNKVDTTSQFYDQDGITGRPVADFKQVGTTLTWEVGTNTELEALLNDILKNTANNKKPGTIVGSEIKAVMDVTKTDAQNNAVDCWYVLKYEKDGWHIDGGDYNTYDITVNYVDTDGNVLYTLDTITKKVGTYTVNAQHSKINIETRDYVLGEDASKEVVLTNEGATVNFVFKKVFKIQAKLDYTLIVDRYADQQRGVDYIALVVEGEDASAYLSSEALKNMETKYASWLSAGKKFTADGFQITTADVNVTELNKDVMIVAHRENIQYTVNFYDFNGSLITGKTYTYNQEVVIPEATAEYSVNGVDYTFKGWNKEVATVVTASADYYAQYNSSIIDYNVVFEYKDANGEDVFSHFTKNFGDEVAAPEVPQYEDDMYTYTFENWTVETEDGAVVVESIPEVTEDVTYVATYTATLKTFTVTYTVDGIEVDSFTVEAGSAVAALLEAEYVPEEGYTFSGWSTDEENEVVLRDITITGTTELIPAPVVVEEDDEEEDVVPGRDPEVEGDEDEVPAKDPEVEGDDDVVPGKAPEVEADDDVVTGDSNTNIGLLFSLLGVSMVGIVTLLLKRKNEKNA